MEKNSEVDPIKAEIARLSEEYKNIPASKKNVIEGLIVECARLRIMLNNLHKDLEENGYKENFTQSEKTAPYERERPTSALYVKVNKNYQTIVKMLVELCPASASTSALDEFKEEHK